MDPRRAPPWGGERTHAIEELLREKGQFVCRQGLGDRALFKKMGAISSRVYDAVVLAPVIDAVCGCEGFAARRREIFAKAKGRVLDVGVGSGHNLPWFSGNKVTEVVGVDTSEDLLRRARKRTEGLDFEVDLKVGDAHDLAEFQDESFDTVAVGFTLCSVRDPKACLLELRRVLKPGGFLLYAEHGEAPERDGSLRTWQRRVTPYWSALAGGCHLDRNPERLVRRAGFEVEEAKQEYVEGMKTRLGE